jgi:hypothetical protein
MACTLGRITSVGRWRLGFAGSTLDLLLQLPKQLEMAFLHRLELALAQWFRPRYTTALLRVFGPVATQETINVAESHYKKALLSRVPHGYNAN